MTEERRMRDYLRSCFSDAKTQPLHTFILMQALYVDRLLPKRQRRVADGAVVLLRSRATVLHQHKPVPCSDALLPSPYALPAPPLFLAVCAVRQLAFARATDHHHPPMRICARSGWLGNPKSLLRTYYSILQSASSSAASLPDLPGSPVLRNSKFAQSNSARTYGRRNDLPRLEIQNEGEEKSKDVGCVPNSSSSLTKLSFSSF